MREFNISKVFKAIITLDEGISSDKKESVEIFYDERYNNFAISKEKKSICIPVELLSDLIESLIYVKDGCNKKQ